MNLKISIKVILLTSLILWDCKSTYIEKDIKIVDPIIVSPVGKYKWNKTSSEVNTFDFWFFQILPAYSSLDDGNQIERVRIKNGSEIKSESENLAIARAIKKHPDASVFAYPVFDEECNHLNLTRFNP